MTNEVIDKMVNQWKEDFTAYFDNLMRDNEKALIHLINENLSELRDYAEKEGLMVEFVWFISKLYTDTVFFPNEKVNEAFTKLKFSQHDLRWFTPIGQILTIFQQISTSKFIVHPIATLEFIRQYLKSKIIDTVLKFYGFTGIVNRTQTNLAAKAIHNFKLRTENKTVDKMSDLDAAFYKLVSDIMQIPDKPFNNLNDLQKYAQGKVKGIYMGGIFNSIIANPFLSSTETGLNEKYRLFYPLAKLIMKDEELFSESEFDQDNDSRVEDKYDGNYDKYRIERLKRILA